ncbi:MAG: chemotaxis protein CheW [Deltaproteobacteria bacterium]|nr:chemotaxis protein CheW [Deltaproteobacteria bacterium]
MSNEALIVDTGRRICALPIDVVLETMRPLPLEALAAAPEYVLGVALIRGEAVPVADLEALLSGRHEGAEYGRFVIVRPGERRVALAVEKVLGVRSIVHATESLAPLIASSREAGVRVVEVQDQQLMTILESSRVIPAATWRDWEAR